MSIFLLEVVLENDRYCNGCPALLDCYDDGDYECAACKCRHIAFIGETENMDEVPCPEWCPLFTRDGLHGG